MGVTDGVSGNGNNYYKVSDFWSKPSLRAANTENATPAAPIKLTSNNNIERKELGFINPYGNADATITEAREIASVTNKIMEELGYPNFKVTPKAVASVSEGLNRDTIPGMNTAFDNSVAARVENPKGPFANLFT